MKSQFSVVSFRSSTKHMLPAD